MEITNIQKRIHNHNHAPTYTKNELERERCIEAISLHDMSVKNAFSTYSINHPQLSIIHFDKFSSIKNIIYRKRKIHDTLIVPKTFNGMYTFLIYIISTMLANNMHT